MKRIPLTQNKYALVDDRDYEQLNQWKWRAQKSINTWYASRRSSRKNGKPKTILMHRLILGLESGDPRETDHKDGSGLNNCRDNLRAATKAQNQHNRKRQKGTSKFKGVYWKKDRAKWRAYIKVERQSIHLGCFNSEMHAARAYDHAAKIYFGEFACTNF